MRLLVGALVVSGLLFASLSAPDGAEAARGGKKAGGDVATASVSLDQTAPALGDSVTFSYTVPGGVSHPRIRLVCSQSGVAVYGWDDYADQPFLLGGHGSQWLTNGGPADCHADLYRSSSTGVMTMYATLDFAAAGAR
ncbi:MAG: hypothetical protein WC273_07505 [Dehalococcoidia bacterium]